MFCPGVGADQEGEVVEKEVMSHSGAGLYPGLKPLNEVGEP